MKTTPEKKPVKKKRPSLRKVLAKLTAFCYEHQVSIGIGDREHLVLTNLNNDADDEILFTLDFRGASDPFAVIAKTTRTVVACRVGDK